jgi:hypothetical protein
VRAFIDKSLDQWRQIGNAVIGDRCRPHRAVTFNCLAINRVAKKWTMPIRDWRATLNQFVILFGEQVTV